MTGRSKARLAKPFSLRIRAFSTAVIAAFAVVAVIATTAHAAQETYTVSRLDDPAPGACTVGDCSLREAIMAANADAVVDRILLPEGTIVLSIPGTTDTSGDLDIKNNIEIRGIGPGESSINGQGHIIGDRVFEIKTGSTLIDHVTIAGGIAPASPADNVHRGGGIRVDPFTSLNLFNSVVTSNHAPFTGGRGGGIFNEGQVLVADSQIVENNATQDNDIGGFGGGIFTNSSGGTELVRSIVQGNKADFGGGLAGEGIVYMHESRLRENRAFLGGGAYVSNGSIYSFVNTNLHGNIADGQGGAIRARNGSASLLSSTVSGNISGGDAGGISAEDDPGAPVTEIKLSNTILAKNTDNATDGQIYPDCQDENDGLFVTEGYNMIGNYIGCDGLNAVTGDQIGNSVQALDPLLQGPQFNGGMFLTQALLPGSTAINRGGTAATGPTACPEIDSRGAPRNGRCDVGAYELVKCKGVLVNRVGSAGEDNSATLPLTTPTPLADGVIGLAGNDTLKGADGNDGLCGGEDDDTLKGGKGNDKLVGGPDKDRLVGGPGRDVCVGGPARDTATGCEVKKSIP